MIKKLLFFVGLMAFSAPMFSQVDYDQRLLAKFPEEKIKELLVSNPEIIRYWTFFLDHSWEVVKPAPGKSTENYPLVKIKIREDFNILETDLTPGQESPQYFRLQNGNLLVLKSRAQISRELNNQTVK